MRALAWRISNPDFSGPPDPGQGAHSLFFVPFTCLLSMVLTLACQKQPLDEPLPDKFVSPLSLEAYLPPDRVDAMGNDLLNTMRKSGSNSIHISASEFDTQFENGSSLVLNAGAFVLVLSEVHPSTTPNGVNLHLVFAPSEADVGMEVSYMGQGTELCQGKFVLPHRESFVHLSLQNAPDGSAELEVDGDPGLSGEPVSVCMNDDCQVNEYMTGKAIALLSDGMDSELKNQLQPVLDELSQLSTKAFGLGMELSGSIGENLLFSILAENIASSSTDAQDCSLSFSGGFDSLRAWCVPSNVSPALPSETNNAVFSKLVPGSQEPYSIAISVSLSFLRQGLLSAYRAGLLCRQSISFRLAFLDPVELFPSLSQLGQVRDLRVSTRPMGVPDLIWGRPANGEQDSLPSVYLGLPDVYMDVFVSMDGLDLHALEIRSSITVKLALSLEDGILKINVAKVDAQSLDVDYKELITERAGDLRRSATVLIEQVMRDLLDPLGEFSLDLPVYSGKNMLGYELDDGHLILYFGFAHSADE